MFMYQVCWEPYNGHRDAHPFHEVSYYCGLLVSFDVVEAYYPERVLRQFGRLQTIPTMPMIPHLLNARGKTSQAYKVAYSVNAWTHDNWRNHLLNDKLRSRPVRVPWECDSKYMEWFLKITHPYVQPLDLRKTPRKIRGQQQGEGPSGCSHCAKKQAGILAALSLLEGALFGGQIRDVANAANGVYDILKAASVVDNEEEERGPESRTKTRHDPSVTATAPARATPPPRKRARK